MSWFRLSINVHLFLVTVSANTSPKHSIEPFRRRSEGNDPATPLVNNSRRVSFQSSPILQCRYSRCARVVNASSVEAAAFKNCHNCSYTYCSRTCRRAHWEKHRKTCLFSRIGSLCRQVIAAIKEHKDTLYHLSLIARRGYISHGHGAVKCFFPCFEAAEKFLSDGLSCLGEITYIRWPDLLPSEMGPQLYSELVQMCKHYNPDTKLVLYVSICVVSETPSTGTIKWERQLVSRCAKMKLSKEIGIPIKDQDNPETLILTCQLIDPNNAKRLKRISVENVQKHLRMRGVSLKRQHPAIFKQLYAYIEDGTCEELTPITLYPKDATTGKSFMCIIMLGANSHSLRQVESAGVRVRTINMLQSEDEDDIVLPSPVI